MRTRVTKTFDRRISKKNNVKKALLHVIIIIYNTRSQSYSNTTENRPKFMINNPI